jgi:hypothetical protein
MSILPELPRSHHRALVAQGWLYGKRFNQWGNPFAWVDGPLHIPSASSQSEHLAGWASSYYESFPPLPELAGTEYDKDLKDLELEFGYVLRNLLPPGIFQATDLESFVYGLASARAQDLGILRKFAATLDTSSMAHLDFGPGMGVHAVWNLTFGTGAGSKYTAVEIDEKNYALQRSLFVLLAGRRGVAYFDALAAEEMISEGAVKTHLNDAFFRVCHVPSWSLGLLDDQSQDLVTATTVLNEISHAAIAYFVVNANRLLREGGYLYIRDSGKTKPGRHDIAYEAFLESIGYVRMDTLVVSHRENMHGVPRLWKKVGHRDLSFDSLMPELVGGRAVVSHGGEFVHSVSSEFTPVT